MSVTKIAARRHATTTGYGVIPIRKRVTMWLCFPRITLPISPPFHHPKSIYPMFVSYVLHNGSHLPLGVCYTEIARNVVFGSYARGCRSIVRIEGTFKLWNYTAYYALQARHNSCLCGRRIYMVVYLSPRMLRVNTHHNSKIYHVKENWPSIEDSEALNSLRRLWNWRYNGLAMMSITF